MDTYSKWGTRLRKQPRVESLFSKSRNPFRSPKKTKPKKEKKVVQLRRAQPSYGVERISQDLKQLFNINAPPRIYPEKSTFFVMKFLSELKRICPFPIQEIQTDNDTAFTDKFSSGVGVTGEHAMDLWCTKNEINHRLIPVGVKELNSKVENTHKKDDLEGPYESEAKISLNVTGYNQRWNQTRRTKALKWKSPNETINDAYIKALALAEMPKQMQTKPIKIQTQKNKVRG